MRFIMFCFRNWGRFGFRGFGAVLLVLLQAGVLSVHAQDTRVELSGRTLTITDINGASNDNIYIYGNGHLVRIHDPGNTLQAVGANLTQIDANTIEVKCLELNNGDIIEQKFIKQ